MRPDTLRLTDNAQTRELTRTPVIDVAMLRIDIWGDAADAAERDGARARRVVEHIRRRFPAVRYTDAPEDVDEEVGDGALDPDRRKVT